MRRIWIISGGVGGGRKLINFPNSDKTFNVFYFCSCDYMTIIRIKLLMRFVLRVFVRGDIYAMHLPDIFLWYSNLAEFYGTFIGKR